MLRNLWRINVPQVGFSNGFVMRSIFALSALHMSLFSPTRRDFYLNVARSEHGAALREIVPLLSHVTADNCAAAYIAAALTFLYAWAVPRQRGDLFVVNKSGAVEWVVLIQGVRSISEAWRTELSSGPFGPMFRLGGSRIEGVGMRYSKSAAWQSTNEHIQLSYLAATAVCAASNAQVAKVYQQSIHNLEMCFCAVFCSSNNLSMIQDDGVDSTTKAIGQSISPAGLTSNMYSWLYKMDDKFIDLLKQNDPVTLVIFAHFCVLLKFLSSCWWMQGWSTHLLQEVWRLLDDEHRLWIRWPIEEIGWKPEN